MKIHELVCHCKVVIDRRGNETLPRENMCEEHRATYDTCHAEAMAKWRQAREAEVQS